MEEQQQQLTCCFYTIFYIVPARFSSHFTGLAMAERARID
jgi:hypothetical protein